MSRFGVDQGAFAWAADGATRGAAGSAPEAVRPDAPPMIRGGGARGASGRRHEGGAPRRARAVPLDRLPPDDELWDVRAAARFLRRSVSWVYHKAEDGTLPVKRLGGWGIRFVPCELRAWVSADEASGKRGR
jgi:predicted DNA-binding transcriptional regulator AlpA